MRFAGNPIRMYGSIRIDALASRTGTCRVKQSDTAAQPTDGLKKQSRLELAPRSTETGMVIATHAVDTETYTALDETSIDEPSPRLPCANALMQRIVAHDLLERVIDEESWLRAMAEALAPGGELILRVPLEGPVAWLDALNLVRYAQDITGWGQQPQDARMKRWHRHYRPSDLERLLRDAGMVVTHVGRSGSPHLEVAKLGKLLFVAVARGSRGARRQVERGGQAAEVDIRLARLGPLSTKLTIRAIMGA